MQTTYSSIQTVSSKHKHNQKILQYEERIFLYIKCCHQRISFTSPSNPQRGIKDSGYLTQLQRAQDQVKLDGPNNQSNTWKDKAGKVCVEKG
jgi:hypothetical protein